MENSGQILILCGVVFLAWLFMTDMGHDKNKTLQQFDDSYDYIIGKCTGTLVNQICF